VSVTSHPSVAVLVVNWNGRYHLEDCLPSLLGSRFQPFEATVLDNGSTDGSQAWLREAYPQVNLIELGHNRGFAAANNVGMRAALANGAQYVVLLNNDTRVDPEWLSALVEAAESSPDAAICAARQRTWEGQHELHFRFIPEWAEAQVEQRPLSIAGGPRPTPFASGCAMLLRYTALRQIGLFDERYFAGVEDVDLTLRAWIVGYQALEVPQSVVYHKLGGSSQAGKRMYWGYRNQLTTLLKLYQVETLRGFAPVIRKRWFWTRNRVALRATLASFAMLPRTLAWRRQVQRQRRVPDRVIWSYL